MMMMEDDDDEHKNIISPPPRNTKIEILELTVFFLLFQRKINV